MDEDCDFQSSFFAAKKFDNFLYLLPDADYEATLSNLTWLGPRCMDLGDWTSPAEAEDHVARWRKTMNLSISCFITALIIITAAVMLVREDQKIKEKPFKRSFRSRNSFHSPQLNFLSNLSQTFSLIKVSDFPLFLLQGLIGVLYNQAACVLVDSVLFQLTVFFSVFGIAIHLYNRQICR